MSETPGEEMMIETNATQEWRTADKASWGAGPWQVEPDKVQWVDETTGLDCLIVRGPVGALCGYVGVPEGHRYFGVDYSGCPLACGESYCDHSPGSVMRVHGGLTFADSCHEATPDGFARFRARMDEDEREVLKYPRGDSAERLRTMGHLRNDYAAWLAHHEATAICHVPLPGRPGHVWWFGFDCAHLGDMSPKYANDRRFSSFRSDEAYRTLDYVREECASLAAQLVVA